MQSPDEVFLLTDHPKIFASGYSASVCRSAMTGTDYTISTSHG